MTIEEKVQALLVAALASYGSPAETVPEARIKVPGDWQGLVRPYVIHFPVSVAPMYTHAGRAPLTQWPHYQVSNFADTYSEARVLADASRDALSGIHDGVHFFWRKRIHMYEDDTRVHHIADEFEGWEAL